VSKYDDALKAKSDYEELNKALVGLSLRTNSANNIEVWTIGGSAIRPPLVAQEYITRAIVDLTAEVFTRARGLAYRDMRRAREFAQAEAREILGLPAPTVDQSYSLADGVPKKPRPKPKAKKKAVKKAKKTTKKAKKAVKRG
jgi:hypothetical protein